MTASRIGVDTGGTFTDLVAEVDGRLLVAKVPSTRADPGAAVLAGLRALGLRGVPVVHGTTVATNSLLERRGARVLFVTTPGFEDIAEIGRQDRPALYDPAPSRPPPLHVAAVGADADLQTEIARARAEAVAVCLLGAYADPADEERIGAALAGQGIAVSLSSRVLREFREYERASTTLADAFVRPVVSRYLGTLARAIAPAPLSVMRSSGGTASAERAASSPVETVLSGPAGGVLGAAQAALRAAVARAISFDMGGTSTDVAIVGGDLVTTTETVVGGVPIAVPALEVHTVGAGGGSIARVDAGGALAVGPESAGAEPGPAAYGRGGEGATVTDAHVVLGHLGDSIAQGMPLDRRAAQRAVGALAARLGVDVRAAAAAILDVADAAMLRPMRRLTVERGIDPRELGLVAFGGAGGLHAARLAEALGVRTIVAPVHPGLASAIGMLGAPARAESSRTVLQPVDSDVSAVADALAHEARGRLEGEGGAATVTVEADVRFVGQSHEIRICLGPGLAERFREAHGRLRGLVLDRPIELVTVRATAEGRRTPVVLPAPERSGADAIESRETSMGETAVYDRSALGAGAQIVGPAIVREMSATTIVPRGWTGTVIATGDLVIVRT